MDNRLPPLWKIKRELKRFPISVMSKARASLSHFHRIRHDMTAHRTVRVIFGDKPPSAEVAIFLIYQPGILLDLLFLTLKHLNKKGMAVVLVANHPIDEAKEALLRPYCCRIIERPNIGYDFGGYREGVLYALRENLRMERLFLLNDSNWFPIFGDSDLIETSREAPEDLYGFFLFTPRPPKAPHIQSYYYRVGKKLLYSKHFARFWKKMPLINEKRIVVRQHEFGLSKLVTDHGYSIGSCYNNISVAKALAKLPPNELKEVLEFYSKRKTFKNNKRLAELAAADLEVLSDRAKVEQTLIDAPEDFYFRYDHPIVMVREMKSPFLKKYRDTNLAAQRAQIFEHGLHRGLHPSVVKEMGIWDD